MLQKVEIFDGGFGSELQKRGMKAGEVPEELNIINPKMIIDIHSSYVMAGCDYITCNSFGLNSIKLKDSKYSVKELVLAACNNALAASKGQKIMFDIGPIGRMLKPLGDLSFDDAYDCFKEVVLYSRDLVDGYILETFSDLYELKAAILAVRENSENKLLYATMTFDEGGRTLTGTTPEIMTLTLEGLGVDALGVNCSLGPWDLVPILKKILSITHTPVIVQANRGLPRISKGITIYDLKLSEFSDAYDKFYEMGVAIMGGCCGTDPDFIKAISIHKGKPILMPQNPYKTYSMSATNLVEIKDVVVCGERLNPTGKKKLKEAILTENYDYLLEEGIKQVNAGANILDLNVGVPMIDEPKTMKKALEKLLEVINLPFQIDSSNKDAMEMGARYSNGIPILNSVNGEKDVMDRVFPIAKKYGCNVLGLTLDEKGIPQSAEERYEIAKRIVDYAAKFGIRKERIIIDTLTLTASSEQKLVKETLDALELVTTRLGVKTALGVSNCSFGLPNRPLLNRTFLTLAMQKGLNMPIINPNDIDMMNAIYAYKVFYNIDKNSENYIAKMSNIELDTTKKTNVSMSLEEMVQIGLKDGIKAKTLEMLETINPMDIINNILIPTLNKVGEDFDKQKVYLPQLIMSAEAAKIAFSVIKEKFPKKESDKRPIIMATVKGDIHDIGKNICCVILESYGYNVVDLGRDVSTECLIEAYNKYNPMAIGLSALMTTSVTNMAESIKELNKIDGMCPIFSGGAVMTAEIAHEIGATYYSKDPLELIEILRRDNIK